MKQTEYHLSARRFGKSTIFALLSDLHGTDPAPVLTVLWERRPDYILLAGDILERLDGADTLARERGLALLRQSALIAPTFYATGNHEDGATRSWDPRWRKKIGERAYAPRDLEAIAESGVILLQDTFVLKNGIAFGGLSSGLILGEASPDLAWLEVLCSVDAPRVLICHHPEYYERYLKELPVSPSPGSELNGIRILPSSGRKAVASDFSRSTPRNTTPLAIASLTRYIVASVSLSFADA